VVVGSWHTPRRPSVPAQEAVGRQGAPRQRTAPPLRSVPIVSPAQHRFHKSTNEQIPPPKRNDPHEKAIPVEALAKRGHGGTDSERWCPRGAVLTSSIWRAENSLDPVIALNSSMTSCSSSILKKSATERTAVDGDQVASSSTAAPDSDRHENVLYSGPLPEINHSVYSERSFPCSKIRLLGMGMWVESEILCIAGRCRTKELAGHTVGRQQAQFFTFSTQPQWKPSQFSATLLQRRRLSSRPCTCDM
jgi:hypothetical protein